MNLKTENDFEGLLGPMTPEAFEQLKSNLKENPASFPAIYVWGNHKQGNVILDGHHQYKARVALGLPVKAKKVDFETRQEAMAFAVKCQLGRRNLSTAALARLANQLRTSAQLPPQEAAQAVGVSPRTVTQYREVQTKGTSELKEAVETGEVSVRDGAAVASKPKSEQKNAIKRKRTGKARTLAKAATEPEPLDPNSLEATQADLREIINQFRKVNQRLKDVLLRPWCSHYAKMTTTHDIEHVCRTIRDEMPIGGTPAKPKLYREQKVEEVS